MKTRTLSRWRRRISLPMAKGFARPQMAEMVKTFGQRCTGVVTNNKLENATMAWCWTTMSLGGWVQKAHEGINTASAK